MKTQWTYLTEKWNYLKGHQAFKKAPVQTIFRTIYWAIACTLGIPATVEFPKWNCRFILPPKFKQAGSTGIFVLREDYEPELAYLDKFLSPGQVFVDAGANSGIYTVVGSRIVGDSGIVVSFEPGVDSFQTLERNVKINNQTNVKLFRSALSNEEGVARFYHIDDAPNSYSLGGNENPATTFEEVATTTLDSVLSREGIERVDLIKMDVEGAEEYVLQGATSLFSRMKPKIIFEINEEAILRFNLQKDGGWNFLKKLGYQFFSVEKTGEILSLDFPLNGNILAIYKG